MNYQSNFVPFNNNFYNNYPSDLGVYDSGYRDGSFLENTITPKEKKPFGLHIPNNYENNGERPFIGNYVDNRTYYSQNQGSFHLNPAKQIHYSDHTYGYPISDQMHNVPVPNFETSQVMQNHRVGEPLNKKRSFKEIRTEDPEIGSRKRARTESSTDSDDSVDITQITLNRTDFLKKTAIYTDSIRAQYLERAMKEISREYFSRYNLSREKDITCLYIRMINALFQDEHGEISKGKSELKKINKLFSERKRRHNKKEKLSRFAGQVVQLEGKNSVLRKENEKLKLESDNLKLENEKLKLEILELNRMLFQQGNAFYFRNSQT